MALLVYGNDSQSREPGISSSLPPLYPRDTKEAEYMIWDECSWMICTSSPKEINGLLDQPQLSTLYGERIHNAYLGQIVHSNCPWCTVTYFTQKP